MRQSPAGELAFDSEAHIHQGGGCRPGRCVGKAVELTLGDLHRVSASGLRGPQGPLTAVQESAKGIVGREAEGPNGWSGE